MKSRQSSGSSRMNRMRRSWAMNSTRARGPSQPVAKDPAPYLRIRPAISICDFSGATVVPSA
jgi:hypothetical protein